jgi:hypothetical protein
VSEQKSQNATKADVGRACTYVDPVGKSHAAIITNVWGSDCVNVVYVVDDKKQEDTYGRKTARETSLMSRDVQQAHGQYWHF